MSAQQQQGITFPVGRMVMGSLYKAQDKDADGRPRVVKTGPNAGKPNPVYFFAVAIPKAGEQHWAHTEWGKLIWAIGHAAFPQGQAQRPDFAWKIDDGDSQTPNAKGNKLADREGCAGCWVLFFTSQFAPKIYQLDASGQPVALLEPDAIKPGYFIEVYGTVAGNGELTKPGVYMNHNMVCLRGYGPEIRTGADPKTAGFGRAPLPQGASAAPVGNVLIAPPPVPTTTAAAPPPVPANPTPTTTVTPHNGFMVPPPSNVTAPPPPAAAPSPPWKGPPGSTYAAYKGAGWTDDQMRAQGYL